MKNIFEIDKVKSQIRSLERIEITLELINDTSSLLEQQLRELANRNQDSIFTPRLRLYETTAHNLDDGISDFPLEIDDEITKLKDLLYKIENAR